jgi:hypothetical protein
MQICERGRQTYCFSPIPPGALMTFVPLGSLPGYTRHRARAGHQGSDVHIWIREIFSPTLTVVWSDLFPENTRERA